MVAGWSRAAVREAASMTARRLEPSPTPYYPIRTARTPCYNTYRTTRRMGNRIFLCGRLEVWLSPWQGGGASPARDRVASGNQVNYGLRSAPHVPGDRPAEEFLQSRPDLFPHATGH